jgi:large exoprotein involved in heme utilization and adhesion
LEESGLYSQVYTGAKGNAGDIKIATNNLSVTNGAEISTGTFGEGNGGIITIKAEKVSVNGTNGTNTYGDASIITSSAEEKDTGNGGEIKLVTDNLSVTNGGQIVSGTFGEGNGGNSTISARESIEISGRGTSRSGIFASALQGSGNGGNLSITTDKLVIKDNGSIGVSNFQTANLLPEGKGAAGNLKINANSIELNNGTINAANANGIGGQLTLNTDTLKLDNGASILASTTANSGVGGNLTLRVQDNLQMTNNSTISAQATEGADGGNIELTGLNPQDFNNFVLLKDGSSIIANGVEGSGGNISIRTRGLFKCGNCAIDASSTFGRDGAVTVTTPDANSSQVIIKSPENAIEPDETVASACGSEDIAKANSFTITGRGGMPTDPTEPLSSSYLSGISEAQKQGSGEAEGLRGGDAERQRGGDAIKLDEGKKTFSSDEVIPARGMMMNEKGQIVLTAYPTPNAGDRNASESNYCSSSVTQEELLATNTPSDRSQEILDDRAIAEIMNLLYSQGLGQ